MILHVRGVESLTAVGETEVSASAALFMSAKNIYSYIVR